MDTNARKTVKAFCFDSALFNWTVIVSVTITGLQQPLWLETEKFTTGSGLKSFNIQET